MAALEAAAEAGAALATGALACGLGDAAELQAAATRTSAMRGAIRSSSLRLTITGPSAITIPPEILPAAQLAPGAGPAPCRMSVGPEPGRDEGQTSR